MPLILDHDHNDLGEYVEALYQAQNINAAFAAFEQYIFKLGFEGALYTFIPRIALESSFPHAPVYLVSECYSPQFLTHYMDANFYKHDYVVKMIEKGALTPLDWWEEVNKGQMNKSEKHVIETARTDYQIVQGITIPAMSDSRGIAGASFISSDNDRSYGELKASRIEQLKLCTQLFHAAVLSKTFLTRPFIEPLISTLSATEKSLIRGLVEGKSIRDIALEIGRDVKYMDKVMRHSREKFSGVGIDGSAKINRNQLIYYIGLLNLLDSL